MPPPVQYLPCPMPPAVRRRLWWTRHLPKITHALAFLAGAAIALILGTP